MNDSQQAQDASWQAFQAFQASMSSQKRLEQAGSDLQRVGDSDPPAKRVKMEGLTPKVDHELSEICGNSNHLRDTALVKLRNGTPPEQVVTETARRRHELMAYSACRLDGTLAVRTSTVPAGPGFHMTVAHVLWKDPYNIEQYLPKKEEKLRPDTFFRDKIEETQK